MSNDTDSVEDLLSKDVEAGRRWAWEQPSGRGGTVGEPGEAVRRRGGSSQGSTVVLTPMRWWSGKERLMPVDGAKRGVEGDNGRVWARQWATEAW